MPDSKTEAIVDQILHGVRVKSVETGEIITVKPFTRTFALEMDALITAVNDKKEPVKTLVDKFFARYPELADHISNGDVLDLVPGFFWPTSGAEVLSARPIGSENGATTASPTDAAQVPSPTAPGPSSS